jgi:predicted DNA-binding protein (UPF0251 family)/DNA-directed RNA polymerase subunit RPC12/RpoP
MRGPYRKRQIHLPPHFKNFKPSGIPRNLLKSLTITVDEYEALRLADYEGLEQLQASEKMGISRPTFTRLIEKARYKLAMAIIEGKELIVEGGNIEFQNTLRRCRDCGDEQISPSDGIIEDCPECGSENVEDFAQKFLINKNPAYQVDKKGEKMKNWQNSGNPGSGRGLGRGGGRGRNKGGSFGTGGFCVCAKCGAKVPHLQGVKCTTVKCPQCGHAMVREELLKK